MPVVVLLDVKNAFNSVSWSAIMEELERRGISQYLQALVKDYLNDRRVRATAKGGVACDFYMHGGVPQGSVLGPLLWNIVFDEVLRLAYPGDTEVVAYADDLTLLTLGNSEGEVENTANAAIAQVSRWLNMKGLRLAPKKTQVLVMAGAKAQRDHPYGGWSQDKAGRSSQVSWSVA